MQECRGSSWQYRQAALVDRGRQDILQTDGDQAQTECQKTELTVYALGFSLTLYQPVVLGYIMSDSLFSTTQSVIHAPQYIYITSAALTCSLWSTRVNWQTAYRGSEPMEEEGVACVCEQLPTSVPPITIPLVQVHIHYMKPCRNGIQSSCPGVIFRLYTPSLSATYVTRTTCVLYITHTCKNKYMHSLLQCLK